MKTRVTGRSELGLYLVHRVAAERERHPIPGDPGMNGLFIKGLTSLKKDDSFFVSDDGTDVGLAKGLSFDGFISSIN